MVSYKCVNFVRFSLYGALGTAYHIANGYTLIHYLIVGPL